MGRPLREINVLAFPVSLFQSASRSKSIAVSTRTVAMNYIYFVAVIGNRLVALACVLALSYLLPSHGFGVYAVAAANALVIQILLASWLSSSANRLLAQSDDDPRVTLSTIAIGMVGVGSVLALVALGYALMPFMEAAPLQVALVLAWSASLMVYDVTLAGKNALGRAGSYASLAIVRNVLALATSVALVAAGYGPTGAIVGQLIGNVLPVVLLPASRRIWGQVEAVAISLPTLRDCLSFGTAGTFALGQYMLVNAASRNLVALTIGEAAAGQWALALDIFYGPLALVGTAYTLSNMRDLYAGHGQTPKAARRAEMGKFIVVNLYFAIPYAVGGALLAPALAGLLFAEQSLPGILPIARGATVQGAAMLALYGLTTILLAIDRRVFLIVSVIGATVLVGGATVAAWWHDGDLRTMMWWATIALTMTVVLSIGYAASRRYITLDLAAIARIAAASLAMGLTILGFQAIDRAGLVLPLVMGILCYAVLTVAFKLIDLRDFIPPGSPLYRKLPFLGGAR